MKKIITIAIVLAIVVVNAMAVVPAFLSKPAIEKDGPVLKQARVHVTDVMPVLLPNLVRL